jgi:hypothetical protein
LIEFVGEHDRYGDARCDDREPREYASARAVFGGNRP